MADSPAVNSRATLRAKANNFIVLLITVQPRRDIAHIIIYTTYTTYSTSVFINGFPLNILCLIIIPLFLRTDLKYTIPVY